MIKESMERAQTEVVGGGAIKKHRPQTQDKGDRQNRDVLQVETTQALWTDIDTNRNFLIDNKGSSPVFVNHGGQIPSRFNRGVTGSINFQQRKQLTDREELSSQRSLSIKVESPNSLMNIQ